MTMEDVEVGQRTNTEQKEWMVYIVAHVRYPGWTYRPGDEPLRPSETIRYNVVVLSKEKLALSSSQWTLFPICTVMGAVSWR